MLKVEGDFVHLTSLLLFLIKEKMLKNIILKHIHVSKSLISYIFLKFLHRGVYVRIVRNIKIQKRNNNEES
jgi:hypothetical protein